MVSHAFFQRVKNKENGAGRSRNSYQPENCLEHIQNFNHTLSSKKEMNKSLLHISKIYCLILYSEHFLRLQLGKYPEARIRLKT